MTINSLDAIRNNGLLVFQRIERAFDLPFGSLLNPWRQLGALGFLCFCLVAATGCYLFVAIDTSASEAYRSIDQLSRQQWYFGGVLRSLHRYAADAFIALTLLHLIREFLLGRYGGFRRFSWLTGIPLLWFAYASGIGGFWLNWDRLGQLSAVATSEWLDTLPIFATPLTRNFLSFAAVSDRLFSLLVFVHIGVPLLLIFGLWFHVQRINHAAVFPPRALTLGTCAALLVLALAVPVLSQGEADLASLPGALRFDWFYLFPHALMYASSPGALWLLVAGVTLILFVLPFFPLSAPPSPVARVDADNCNGCRRCFDDCPYAAIAMLPHPAGKPGQQVAAVLTERCASCGICAGSCPSSTPFRNMRTLVSGIDMPQLPVDALRHALLEKLAALACKRKIVVFGCDHGAKLETLAAGDVAYISLLCVGMLPPAFIEYALREGAAGVLVTGCRENGCAFRLGSRWTEQRLLARREPQLRSAVPCEQLCFAWADPGEEAELQSALAAFRRRIAAEPAGRHIHQ
ncbi:MAG: hydrogenase iron-sulfur subunit [Sterolibacterium sp.]